MRTLRLLITAICICSSSTILRADVVAEALQNLGVTFSSSTGALVFIGANDGMVFGSATDSFSGTFQNMVDGGSGLTTLNVSTPPVFVNMTSVGGAEASGTAHGSALFSSTSAVAELFNVAGTASATNRSTMTGTLEIQGAGPQTLDVSAALQSVDHFAEADSFGLSGSVEAIVSVVVGSPGSQLIGFDNLLSVGPSQQKSLDFSQTLTGTETLNGNTQYAFTVLEESDASAANGASLPEPSYWLVSIVLLSGLAGVRLTRGSKESTMHGRRG